MSFLDNCEKAVMAQKTFITHSYLLPEWITSIGFMSPFLKESSIEISDEHCLVLDYVSFIPPLRKI